MSKRPLVFVAILFASGILFGRAVSAPVWLSLGLALGVAWAALAAPRGRSAWLALQIVGTGAANYAWQTAPLAPDDLRHRFGDRPELVTVRGVMSSSPEYRLHVRRGEVATNSMAMVDCRGIAGSDGAFESATGRLLVTTPGAVTARFPVGTPVEIGGILERPPGPAAPGTFDYRTHLRWRGVHFELRAPEPGDWRRPPGVPEPGPGWADRFQDWARRALAMGLPEEDAELRLLWAMTLGWKTGITDEVEEPFMRSGTMHIFAISGLHIALIAAIAVEILRFIRVPRVVSGLIVLPLCWGYTAATGWQPSAVRSTLMTSFVVVGWMLERPLDLLNSLAAAALACLVWEPTQLFQAGFQLSFAVVATLAMLATPLQQWLRKPADPDPFLAESRIPKWRRGARTLWGWAAASLAVSLTAWAGSLPLSAHYFHLVTPGSLVANLIVVPLSSAALASNLAGLVFAGWAPALTEWFNHGAWFWMRLMLVVSRWAAGLPGGCWNVAAPPVAASVLWYLLLCVVASSGMKGSRVWTRWLVAGVAVLLGAWATVEWSSRGTGLRVVVLPLRGGHAVWLDHHGRRGLIDTGDARSAEGVVRPFLAAEGVNRLPRLLLTHGDIRHVGGMTSIVVRFEPREVFLSPVRFRSAAWKPPLGLLDLKRPGVRLTGRNEEGLAPWRVRHPAEGDKYGRADDGCLVLEVEEAETQVLLLADLGRLGQEAMLQRYPELRADVVVTGLPANDEPLGVNLLAQLQPRLVIVADTELPATARAKAAVRARLRSRVPRVIFTAEAGSVDVRIADGRIVVLDAAGRVIPEEIATDRGTPDGGAAEAEAEERD